MSQHLPTGLLFEGPLDPSRHISFGVNNPMDTYNKLKSLSEVEMHNEYPPEHADMLSCCMSCMLC